MVDATYGEIYAAFADRIALFNNLIEVRTGKAYAIMVAHVKGMAADYNMMVGGKPPGLGRDAADIAWGSHNFVARTAGFANDQSGDLHLTAGSEALKRASPAHAPANDLDGKRRPTGGPIDVGAYQYSH